MHVRWVMREVPSRRGRSAGWRREEFMMNGRLKDCGRDDYFGRLLLRASSVPGSLSVEMA